LKSQTRTRLIVASAGAAALAAVLGVGAVVGSNERDRYPVVSEQVQHYYDEQQAKGVVITQAPAIPLVSVIGDSYTAGSGEGGLKTANWVPQADTAVTSATMVSKASGGSGYVNPGPKGRVFRDLIPESVKPTTDLVVFFGSRNDQRNAQEVRAAAEAAYAEARKIAPEAKLLVIGAPWVDAAVPESITAINAALAEATAAAGGTFVDPVSANWYIENPSLIGKDGVHPTDEGHAYTASKIAPLITAALG